MDLGTSVKGLSKVKYSPIFKIACVLLCIVTFLLSLGIGMKGLSAVTLRYENAVSEAKNGVPENWTQTYSFERLIYSRMQLVDGEITVPRKNAAISKELEENKDNVIKLAIEQYNSIKDSSYYDEYGDLHYPEDEDTVISVPLKLKSYGNTVHDFTCYATELPDDETKLLEVLNYKYDEFAESVFSDYSYFYNNSFDEVNFYAKCKDNELSYLINSNEAFSEAVATKSDHYIIIENCAIKATNGIPTSIAENMLQWFFTDNAYAKDVYACIYFNDSDLVAPDFVHSFDSDKGFSSLKKQFEDTQSTYDNIVPLGILAVLSLVASFVFAFVYFSTAGKKSKDEKSRVYFWDHIFFELQLAIIGLACFGLGTLCTMYTQSVNYFFLPSNICIVWSLFIFFCQICLFALCSSIARFIGSGKKFYKHLLIFWIFFGIFKVLGAIFKGIARSFKKLHNKNKRLVSALTYKPKKFKRNLIILSIIYAIVNLLLAFFIAATFYLEEMVFTIPLALIAIIGNVAVLHKVMNYIKNLDTIIAASEQHIDSGLDNKELDPSLRVLNESIRYTNAELQQAIAKAVKDERLRTELITNVSHDLKTPLTSIINYVDLLTKCDISDEKAHEYLNVLSDKSGKLKRLIEDLIEASKLSSGNITVNLSPLNLTELCLQSTVEYQTDFEKEGLVLVIKQGEKPITVIGDGSKTYRVIENLLSNAKKYSAKASRVYVSAYSENNYGVIEIKNVSAKPLDISAEELTERFVRGDASRTQEGNGLGLSIAKELCKAQKGELELIIDGDLFKAKVKLPREQ